MAFCFCALLLFVCVCVLRVTCDMRRDVCLVVWPCACAARARHAPRVPLWSPHAHDTCATPTRHATTHHTTHRRHHTPHTTHHTSHTTKDTSHTECTQYTTTLYNTHSIPLSSRIEHVRSLPNPKPPSRMPIRTDRPLRHTSAGARTERAFIADKQTVGKKQCRTLGDSCVAPSAVAA